MLYFHLMNSLQLLCPDQLQHSSAAVLGTNSQCIGIGQIRSPRESGSMDPIEMPFGTFDYLGDLTKFPKFHRASPIGRGPTRGRRAQVDSCHFLCFYCYLSSTGRRALVRANFSHPKGTIPLAHVHFCGSRTTNSYFGG